MENLKPGRRSDFLQDELGQPLEELDAGDWVLPLHDVDADGEVDLDCRM